MVHSRVLDPDPDLAFYLSADPDPGTLNFYMKNILYLKKVIGKKDIYEST
jgi:hypothetical protein